jgi:hypothetical protein
MVGTDKELVEKLNGNDRCPCGSGRRFQAMLPADRSVRRGPEPSLRPRPLTQFESIERGTYDPGMDAPGDDPPVGVELFDTAEEAALSGWASTPSAHARVVEVRPTTDFHGAYVVVQTDGHPGFHDRDIASCVRASNRKWWENGSTDA